MKKPRILTTIKEKKDSTSIKFSRDTREIRKRISILIFVLILVGNISLALYSTYIFYSFTQLRITPTNLQQTQPDNETIIISGSIKVESIIEITGFVLNISLITDEDLILIEESYEKERILSNEETEFDFEFIFSFIDLDLALFLSLNTTDYIIFNILTTLNYGGFLISFEIQFKQDIGVLI